MRKLFYLSLLSFALLACAEDVKHEPTVPADPVDRFLTQSDKENHLYQDTITPPSNPLVPPTEDTYTTRGVFLPGYLNGNLAIYPAIQTLHSSTYFYLLDSGNQFAKFNHPLLAGLQTGDTIAVTGETLKINYKSARYGIRMTEIKLLGKYTPHYPDNEEKGGEE